MIKMVLGKINDLSIRSKLSLLFILLIFIPLCMFLFINIFVTSKGNEEQAVYSTRQVLNQTGSFLEYKTESFLNSLNSIAFNDMVIELIQKDPKNYTENAGLWAADSLNFDKILLVAKNNRDIYKVHLYMENGLAAEYQNEDFIDLKNVIKSNWYKRLVSGGNTVEWFGREYFSQNDETNCIYVLRAIPSSENYRKSIGVVRLDIQEKIFSAILDQAVFTRSASAILLNNSNEIICTSGGSAFKECEPIRNILTLLSSNNSNEGLIEKISLNKEKFLVGVQDVRNTDWRLLLFIPYDDILSINNKSRNQMILIILIISPLMFPLVFFISASSAKRIKTLIMQMRKVVDGNFNVSILPSNKDEIGELTQNFNYMLTRLALSMDEKYMLGKEIKSMELKALQAQINPHFLYNTLDLINWMSVRTNTPEISLAIQALSRFYKLSLSKGEDMVTIENELEHVKAYVEIQNMRYKNSISLKIEVPESLYQFMIPKITLQPIVENSIFHGIFEKEDESGLVRIRGELSGNNIFLYIQDDGVGMSGEKISQIMAGEGTTENHHGYGIKNINERIRLHYGGDYGLSFDSKPGEGTIVLITISAQPKEYS